MKKMAIFLVLIVTILLIPTRGQGRFIYMVEIKGEINSSTESIFRDSLTKASEDGAYGLIVMLDTPGGRGDFMMNIIKLIGDSKVPVIIYVAPSGAIAASAGTYIAMASHFVGMAPGTSIGACQPILGYAPTGEIIEAGEKTEKFYTSYMKSLAESHGRDGELAEKFVSENLSLTPREALEAGMIDAVANDVYELLIKLDDMETRGEVKGEKFLFDTDGLEVVEIELSLTDKLLQFITSANVAYLLLMIGIYGLIFGFMTPGWHVPETIGAVCIALAIVANGYVGINIGGVILIIMALMFFIIELKTPTFGLFTVAGAICFFLGSIFLYQGGGGEGVDRLVTREWYENFRNMIIVMTLISVGFFGFALGKALQLRRTKPQTGWDELMGMKGEVIEEINPRGKIKVRGEIWKAESSEIIKKGEKVLIVGREGFILKVKKGGE